MAVMPAASGQRSQSLQPIASCAPGLSLLGISDALDKATFEDAGVNGLSGLTYDRTTGKFISVSDRQPRAFTLDIPLQGDPVITAAVELRDTDGTAYNGGTFDGEGIAITSSVEWLISSELEPAIHRFAPDGTRLETFPTPEKFLIEPAGRGEANGAFESLALAPGGRNLFTANERVLIGDDRDEDDRGRHRILRYRWDDAAGTFLPAEEYFYSTEPDQDIVEIAALTDSSLLVMERGLSFTEGFTARIFRVSLSGATNVSDIDRLADGTAQPLRKWLLADISDCIVGDGTTFGMNLNPIMDNFEAMALGPELPGGNRALIVNSDDNFQDFQTTRFLILSVDNNKLVYHAHRSRYGGRLTQ